MTTKNRLKYHISVLQYYLASYIYDFFLRTNISNLLQRNRLSHILQHAYNEIPYYSTLLDGQNINFSNVNSVMEKIPPLSKDLIRQNMDNICSSKLFSKSNWQNTGGSTGEPLRFPVFIRRRIWGYEENINQMILYRKMGYSLGDVIVSIDGSRVNDIDVKNNIFWKEGNTNFPYGKIHYSTLYLDDKNAKYYINHLAIIRPQFLRGYPSGIKTLCSFIEKESLVVPRIKGVYLTSENFNALDAEYITSVLKCPVWGQYGHSEMSIFAIKDSYHSEYFCSPFYGYTEILNECSEHVNIGEEGEVVVTGFSNYAMPFIRYKTGDIAIYGGKRRNGTVIIKSLLGRDCDYIIDNEGNKHYLVGLVFGGHINAFNTINQWQIEQKEKGVLIIKIKSDDNSEKIIDEIKEFFLKYGFMTKIQKVNNMERTIRGKQKLLIQHLSL